jgi:hypothetical protein
MKPCKLAVLALAALSFALPLQAQTVDPLWTKTLARAALVKKWAPEDKLTSIDAAGEGKHEIFKTKAHMKGWEKGAPLYDEVQLEPKLDPGKAPGKAKGAMPDGSSMSDELMRPNAAVKRADGQLLHGKTWTLFQVTQSDGPAEVTLKLWVDPLTGAAHQVESKVHATLMLDALLTTSYAPHPLAGSLPERTDLQLKVLVPFKKASANIVSTMSNWIPRPN